MATYEGSPSDAALVALAQAVSDQSNHAAIARDAESALGDLGVPVGDLPAGALDALKGVSEDDLAQIAQANQRLIDFGFKVDTPQGSCGYL
jgi:hypothetical protein